jgi:integrase/recombinase XerC
MNTLGHHITTYVGGRVRRGEISHNTARQLRWRLAALAEAHGNRPIDKLGDATIDRWLEATGDQRQSSRRAYWSTADGFLGWMVANRHMRRNPLDGRRAPKEPTGVPRALDSDQVAALLAAAPDSRAKAIIWLEVGLGLRCIEVARLDVDHWSRHTGIIRVTGKADYQRELPVTDEVRWALDRYLDEVPATHGPLLRRQIGDRLQASWVSHLVCEWLTLAGVKRHPGDGVGAHSLRHTAASDVLDACGDLRVVQEMLGHRNLATTARYLRRAGLVKMRAAMSGRSYSLAA